MGLFDLFEKKEWNIIYPNPQTGRQALHDSPDRLKAISTVALMFTKGVVPDYVNYGNNRITQSQLQDLFIDAIVVMTLQNVCEEDGCDIEQLIQSFKSHDVTYGKHLNSNCKSLVNRLNTDKNDFMLAVATRVSRVGIQNIFNQKTP